MYVCRVKYPKVQKHLTLSSICTHFNILKKKALENIVEKGDITKSEQFHLFPQYFLCNLYLKILLIATFQLSSAASLNLGRSQNGVLGNGFIRITSVNSTNQASDVCRRTTSGSDNNNPHSNVNNNMTTSNVFDFKEYEVDKMYSPQCKRETLYCYDNARSIKRHSPNF